MPKTQRSDEERCGWYDYWYDRMARATMRLADGHEVDCLCALRFRERLRGLLWADDANLPAEALAFPRCRSIHTFGMAYPIDVAMVDPRGRVVLSVRGLGPGRVVREPRASLAVERRASGRPWPLEGEAVTFEPYA